MALAYMFGSLFASYYQSLHSMNRIYILLLSFSFSLYACKTANKAYDKGNYTNAIELAIKKLQKNPNDGESKALAKNAYNNAVNNYQNNIRSLSNTTGDSRFVKLYNEYRQLQNLYLLVKDNHLYSTSFSLLIILIMLKPTKINLQKYIIKKV
jgi:hypothetical protein